MEAGWDAPWPNQPNAPRRAGMRRLYVYILSAIGLGATFTGLALLLAYVVDVGLGKIVWAEVLRPRLAAALATLSVGLPLWWLAWRPMQAEALASGDAGDHARRSIIRKVYLYLALFVSVVGGMIAAASLLNLLLRSLFGSSVDNLLQQVLKYLEYLFLFVGMGIYHGLMLGRDGKLASEALAEKHAAFPVLVFDHGDGSFGQAILAALHKQAPRLPAVAPASRPAGRAGACLQKRCSCPLTWPWIRLNRCENGSANIREAGWLSLRQHKAGYGQAAYDRSRLPQPRRRRQSVNWLKDRQSASKPALPAG